ncbi:MAG: hypothetical protein JSR46_09240, partial [Verrucomicrobia bacterium]|nr:hypothetical protein [Verrucomicrobiota bacterium]
MESPKYHDAYLTITALSHEIDSIKNFALKEKNPDLENIKIRINNLCNDINTLEANINAYSLPKKETNDLNNKIEKLSKKVEKLKSKIPTLFKAQGIEDA